MSFICYSSENGTTSTTDNNMKWKRLNRFSWPHFPYNSRLRENMETKAPMKGVSSLRLPINDKILNANGVTLLWIGKNCLLWEWKRNNLYKKKRQKHFDFIRLLFVCFHFLCFCFQFHSMRIFPFSSSRKPLWIAFQTLLCHSFLSEN